MSIAAQLSDFALSCEPGDGAQDVQRILRLSLYDWMVCGMAGAGEPVARIVRDSKPAQSAGACVFGADGRFAASDAALINGATSHALDYDDTHFAHIGHPSVAVFPAVLALGQSGAEILWAAVIGAEVSVRVGMWLGRSHYQAGFHQTATAGAFGATAAAGRLLGLSGAQMQAAFGVAATQAAGLKSQFGTMGKPYHAGLAARTGVEAALLAKAGFDTRGAGIDGPQGFGPTHHGEGTIAAFEGLGTRWQMETVSHKFHACCHGLHAMLEALAGFEGGAQDVARIEVTTHPRWLSVCNIAQPGTGLETKFSYAHTAAMALAGRDTAALESYTDALARDPMLGALRVKVDVQGDENVRETATRVVVVGHDGTRRTLVHDLDAPMSITARAERLRRKGRALVGALEDPLWQATQSGDPEALHRLMGAPLHP